MKEKIIGLMGNKNFNSKAELTKYLKGKLGIVGNYSPQEFGLEEAIDQCQKEGMIERVSYLRVSKK